jgi:hypothetical protein
VFVVSGNKKGAYVTGTVEGNNLLIEGDLETNSLIVGQDFTAKALLPHIYYRGQEKQDSSHPPKVRKLKIRGFQTGAYSVSLKVPGRNEFTKECTIRTPNNYLLGSTSIFRVAESTVPCMCDGDRMDLTIQAPYPIPTHIQEITWNGTYNTQGIAPR